LGDGGEQPQPLVVAVDGWAARAGPVGQADQPLVGKPAPPAAHAVWVHADQPSDLPVRQALGGQQHDLGAGGVALRGGVRADASPQLGTLGIGQGPAAARSTSGFPREQERQVINHTHGTSAGLH
jgi:hypothetical protein